MRPDAKFCRVKHLAQNLQIHNLLRQKAQGVSAGVAGVIPNPVPIQPVLNLASRTIIHRRADAIEHTAVGLGIKTHAHLLLLVDGLDKPWMIWYHSVDA